MTLPLTLSVAAILFALGVFGALTRRNAIGVLMSIELMANAVNINLVAFAHYTNGVAGQTFALFAMALTVVEVAVALAIVVLLYRARRDIQIDLASEMQR
jgi:NADH-quinone oxidoreductase subunit K